MNGRYRDPSVGSSGRAAPLRKPSPYPADRIQDNLPARESAREHAQAHFRQVVRGPERQPSPGHGTGWRVPTLRSTARGRPLASQAQQAWRHAGQENRRPGTVSRCSRIRPIRPLDQGMPRPAEPWSGRGSCNANARMAASLHLHPPAATTRTGGEGPGSSLLRHGRARESPRFRSAGSPPS